MQSESLFERSERWISNGRRFVDDVVTDFFRFAGYTFLAATLRWTSLHSSSFVLSILSWFVLIFLFGCLFSGALSLIKPSHLKSMNDTEGKVLLVLFWILSFFVAILYCYAISVAVDGIVLTKH